MKILFVACYSPLINNSASIETLQYLNNLAKEPGNEIHLLTVDFPKNSIYYDEYIKGMLDERVHTHIISGGKIFEKIMPKKRAVSAGGEEGNSTVKSSNMRNVLRSIKNVIAIPDMYLHWANKAAKYGIDLMKSEKFDVIFSMHEPPSSHICAMKIKKQFKDVPWVTYWSDPWLKDSTRENINGLRRSIESSLEKQVVNLSDRFIFVTKANRDDYIATYGIDKDKTFIVTRGYDELAYQEIKETVQAEKINKSKVNFIYAGEIFSKLRNVNPFVEAVKEIQQENIEIYNKLSILFFGNIDDVSMENNLKSLDNAEVSPRIPYNKALSYMLNGDVLLIFGNKNSKQIPAKIYDYFGADGRIFVILGDENDPIQDVVTNKEKCIVVNNNTPEIKAGIYKLIDSLEQGVCYGPIEDYKWERISKRLNDILKGYESCM